MPNVLKRNRERTKERLATYTYIARGAVRWGARAVAVYDERDVLQSAPMTPPEGGVGTAREDLRIPVLDLGRRCSLVRKHKFRGSRPFVFSRSQYAYSIREPSPSVEGKSDPTEGTCFRTGLIAKLYYFRLLSPGMDIFSVATYQVAHIFS